MTVSSVNIIPLDERIQKRFSSLINKPWSFKQFLKLKKTTEKKFSDFGFFDFSINEKIIPDEKNKKVDITIEVEFGVRRNFHISGNQIVGRKEIQSYFKKMMVGADKALSVSEIKALLDNYYEEKGIVGNQISVTESYGKSRRKYRLINYYVKILEGDYQSLGSVDFLNLTSKNLKVVSEYFDSLKMPFRSRGKFNLEEFKKAIREIESFLKKMGYYNAELFLETETQKSSKVKIKVYLGDAFFVGKITHGFNLSDYGLRSEPLITSGEVFSSDQTNKEKNRILSELKSLGFYFARLKNNNPNFEIIEGQRLVDVNFNIKPGLKHYLEKLILKV